jgi:ribonucleoside-diphosphate reductase beta chain
MSAQRAMEKLLGPQELYELWERQPWASQTIDLSSDRVDWEAMSPEDRDEITWGLSSFLVGEEKVTTELIGLLGAAEDQSEASFLASQMVDEARHMQFLDRFYQEVAGVSLPSVAERLDTRRVELSGAFITLFDDILPKVRERLLACPRDVEAKVDFVTIYHLVVEGTLAMNGQQIILEYFGERDIFAGARAGFEHMSTDEHRHIAYGVWYLRRQLASSTDLKELVRDRLYELLPVVARILVPANERLLDGDGILFGRTWQSVNEQALKVLKRRLKIVGVDLT